MALTAKNIAFCEHYALKRSGPQAYRHAYDCSPEILDATVANEASKLLGDPEITAKIDQLTRAALATSPVIFDIAAALNAWLEIADADPNELIRLRVGCCRFCYGDGHGYQWREREFLEACDKADRAARKDPDTLMPDIAGGFGFNHTLVPVADCPQCRGEGLERVVPLDTTKLSKGALRLYGGVKQTKHGVEIIIADRMKALENANRVIGAFTDKVRLDGSLQAMVEAVQLTTTDPHAAAKAYQDMIARKMAR